MLDLFEDPRCWIQDDYGRDHQIWRGHTVEISCWCLAGAAREVALGSVYAEVMEEKPVERWGRLISALYEALSPYHQKQANGEGAWLAKQRAVIAFNDVPSRQIGEIRAVITKALEAETA